MSVARIAEPSNLSTQRRVLSDCKQILEGVGGGGPYCPFRSRIGIPSVYWGLARRTMFLSEGPKV